jgi:hypothetical protein
MNWDLLKLMAHRIAPGPPLGREFESRPPNILVASTARAAFSYDANADLIAAASCAENR